eukprot:m.59568 g.59568  ORF g.59568 m.59568 type:complete len:425 (+) comp49257_c0_seq1:344-1618(+)
MSAKERPVLTGQRLKSRKRDEKTKFEPEAFRDELIDELLKCEGDFGKAVKFLENSGNTLDYRRYSETFFDVLIAGGILAPGGSVVEEEDVPLSPFSLFGSEDTDESIKNYAQLMHLIIRRYKYLQVALEEEVLKLLKFVKQFPPDARSKLARFIAHLVEDDMLTGASLNVLLADGLVKDGEALSFMTEYFRETLKLSSMNSLAQTLRRAKIDDRLEELFPHTRRSLDEFNAHFERAGLPEVVAYQAAQAVAVLKRDISQRIAELLKEEPVQIDAMIAVAKEDAHKAQLPEGDILVLLFDEIMSSLETNKKQDLFTTQALALLQTFTKLFAAFATSLASQSALILRLQVYCYENQALLKSFQKIVFNLYQADVLSEEVILHWYTKSHSPKGKTYFIEQMTKFVEWLKHAEEESDDDEEDEEEEAK